MRRIALLVVLATIGYLDGFEANAQVPGYTVAGVIIDSLSSQGLPNASVVLQNYPDTNLKFNVSSIDKGRFTFKNIPAGLYILHVGYIGYKPCTIDSVVVRKDAPSPTGLSVKMVLDQNVLKAVAVNATKPFIIQTTDKIVLNVAESPIAAGGNIYDVLSRIPGLITQGSSFQFRGKPVAVLIDDKYTNLSGDDLINYLSTMPANSIEKIEVIPNPSAKYDAQGGAVINIRTAKNKNFGTNGIFTAGIGTGRYARYNSGLSLNYRNKNINVYSSYDYQHNGQYYNNHTDRFISNGATLLEDEYDVRKRDNHSFKLGMDYDISKKSVFSVLVKGMDNFRNRAVSTRSLLGNTGNQSDSLSTVASTGRAVFYSPSVNVFYKTTFDSSGKELKINADYFEYDKGWDDVFATHYFDAKGQEYTNPLFLRDHSPARNTVRSLSADYTLPTTIGKIEAGLKTTFTTTDNNVRWQQNNGTDWIIDSSKTNHFIYRENINAAYINGSRTIKKFSLQLGLRVEQTNTEGNLVTLGQVNKRNYTYLFPNASLQYAPSDDQQYGFSYHENIVRPGFDLLNPFIIYRSQYDYWQGNPNILPTRSHNFELSYGWKNELLASLNYSHYQDEVADIFRKSNIPNAVVNTSVNLGSANNVDASLTLTKSLFNGKWATSNTAGAFYARYNAAAEAQLNKGKVTAYATSENMFILPKGFKGELTAYYYSPMVFDVYHFKSRYWADAGISKSILQSKGSIALNVTDIFNTMIAKFDISSFGVQSYNSNKTESRFVKLVFTYKLGNKNVKSSGNRNTGIEEEKNRMGGN